MNEAVADNPNAATKPKEGITPSTLRIGTRYRANRVADNYDAIVVGSGKRHEINSMPHIQLPPKGPGRDRVLSMDEAAAMFGGMVDYDEYAPQIFIYMIISFNTLARPDAILDLTPSQVDYDNDLIKLNPEGRIQTKKRRPVIPMSKTLRLWLKIFEKHYMNGGQYFVNFHGKKIKSVKHGFANNKVRALLTDPKIVPYTIRHTMATELRKRSVPKLDVEGFLGHSGESTSDIYSHYDPSYLKQAVNAIDSYFGELDELVEFPLC